MRIQFAQHVPFEDPGAILQWAITKGHEYAITRFYEGDALPAPDSWDTLILMGGPMSIHDEHEYAWLKQEKEVIAQAVSRGKNVVGFCLGAQLIAAALGANVYPNTHKEIGWFPIRLTPEGLSSLHAPGQAWPAELPVFHWHGETFDLPEGAVLLASSAACQHQAFAYGSSVFGFQFHLEMLEDNILSIIENCGDELKEAPYIQSKAEILKTSREEVDRATAVLYKFLDKLGG
ncbi:type 1 glutamine amidotransferase [Cohnella fermenti]|uniref:Amidotransferase n=1 Tax=Cohnella fermenti TaxID=2565925 RepID=A0A4S4BQL9_9BACL|nr:amidotransferase [Cohnella fermenti]THF76420.1 amidotransferase [Cohnella fermenti]